MFQWVECQIERREGSRAVVRIKTIYSGSARYEVPARAVAIAIETDGSTHAVVACRLPQPVERLLAVRVPGIRRCSHDTEEPVVLPAPEALFNPNGHQAVIPLPA